jgi:hypothetical protein
MKTGGRYPAVNLVVSAVILGKLCRHVYCLLGLADWHAERAQNRQCDRYQKCGNCSTGRPKLSFYDGDDEEDPMPARQVHLELIDAAELAEALTFISQWLASPDQAQLAVSFGRFVGTDSYDLASLHADLARSTFLLGYDDGVQLFGTDAK